LTLAIIVYLNVITFNKENPFEEASSYNTNITCTKG